MQNADIREIFRHFRPESGVALRIRIVTAALTENRQNAAVSLHDHTHQRRCGASGGDVVRPNIGNAVRVRNIRVDSVAYERIRQRHKCQSVDMLARYQLVNQSQLVLDIHIVHRTHNHRNIRNEFAFGEAGKQVAQHPHKHGM